MISLTSKDHKKIGSQLQNARKSHKMSLANIAKSLRIKESFIQAVEDGEWSRLPGETYARGYIRQYSSLLEIANPLEHLEDLITLKIQNSKAKSKDSIVGAISSEIAWFNNLTNYWQRVRQNSLGSGVHKRRRSLLAETRIGFSSPAVAMMMIVIFVALGTSAGLWFILSKQESVHQVQLIREIPERLQYLLEDSI